jgi:hypothetical protein
VRYGFIAIAATWIIYAVSVYVCPDHFSLTRSWEESIDLERSRIRCEGSSLHYYIRVLPFTVWCGTWKFDWIRKEEEGFVKGLKLPARAAITLVLPNEWVVELSTGVFNVQIQIDRLHATIYFERLTSCRRYLYCARLLSWLDNDIGWLQWRILFWSSHESKHQIGLSKVNHWNTQKWVSSSGLHC